MNIIVRHMVQLWGAFITIDNDRLSIFDIRATRSRLVSRPCSADSPQIRALKRFSAEYGEPLRRDRMDAPSTGRSHQLAVDALLTPYATRRGDSPTTPPDIKPSFPVFSPQSAADARLPRWMGTDAYRV